MCNVIPSKRLPLNATVVPSAKVATGLCPNSVNQQRTLESCLEHTKKKFLCSVANTRTVTEDVELLLNIFLNIFWTQ